MADDVFVANLEANEVLVHDGAGGGAVVRVSPVERTDSSYGGFVFDATGDGTVDDVFVANYSSKRSLGPRRCGWWSRRESGPVERYDGSYGGFVFDATGDGTADDVFVANDGQANEVLVHDGAGGGAVVRAARGGYRQFLMVSSLMRRVTARR